MSRYGTKTYKKWSLRSLDIPKLVGAVAGIVGFFLLFALSSFNVNDPSWFYYNSATSDVVHNLLGTVGASIAALCFYVCGTAAYLLIPFCLYLSHCLLADLYDQEYDRLWIAPLTLATVCLLFYVYSIGSQSVFAAGGIIGRSLYSFLSQWFDSVIITLFVFVVLLAQFLILTRISLIMVAHVVHSMVVYAYDHRHIWFTPIVRGVWHVCGWIVRVIYQCVRSIISFVSAKLSKPSTHTLQEQPVSYAIQYEKDQAIHQPAVRVHEVAEQIAETGKGAPVHRLPLNYHIPGVSLFSISDRQQQNHVTSEHTHMSKVLEEKLSRFGVIGTVTKIKPGPVVTLFEYQPDIDSKVSKILALEHDLALALEAMSVRIIAPIPGTSKVGFEVSNKERKSVKMGDIAKSPIFMNAKYHLPLVLGQDTAGDNVVVDLLDMPHLLVAGSTGSGKSIALNVMLASLLCKLSPEELKLIIIDPKRLEFAAYHDIAHLLFPVITDARKAAPVVQWLVKTMEDRYELMAQKGVRNILDYKRMCKEKGEHDILPFIVLMIDELADLMMVAGKDIEGGIARLAQMARAAGIHLIVATQRPSVDVITGVIKVNFPSRMSFRVSSKIDSRTIIDTGGAELLLGKGDMLFMDAQSSRIRRIHGAYVSDSEISALVRHIHGQATVAYIDLQEAIAAYHSAQQGEQEDDPLLQEVVGFLSEVDEISISLLQRRFKIGYNRSARLIELLEIQGRIMPSMGGKMRKVIR